MKQINIHPLTWLFAALAAATGFFAEAVCAGLILIIHELGHAFAAKTSGWRITKIELLPFGGKLETDEHAGRPLLEEWFVVAAGPFTHVLMLMSAVLLLKTGLLDPVLYELFFQLNAFIFLFNLLPVLPLDGGKMVQLFLCTFRPYYKAYEQSVFYSFIALICLLGAAVCYLPFYLHLMLTVSYIAMQLLIMWKEKEVMFIRFLTARFYDPVPVPMRTIRLSLFPGQSLLSAVRLFRRNRLHLFHANGRHDVTEHQLLQFFFQGKKNVRDITKNID